MRIHQRSAFTLIEMMIAVALSTMIVYVAMAGFRVATQCTTQANRMSLENSLMRAGYQVGQAAPRDLLYQLSLGGPGELLLREESRGQQGTDVSVRNRSLSVFGLDPYIRYDCPLSGIRCVLHNPADGTPLLSVLRDQQGAEELAKALSFLLRNLQQN